MKLKPWPPAPSSEGEVEAAREVERSRGRQKHEPDSYRDMNETEHALPHGRAEAGSPDAGEELAHVYGGESHEQGADRIVVSAEEHDRADDRQNEERDRHERVGARIASKGPAEPECPPVNAVSGERDSRHVQRLIGERAEPAQADEQEDAGHELQE